MKKFLQILPITIIAAIITFSCQKEIDIKSDPLDEQLVVEGKIIKGESPEIILTKTGFYYDPIDANTIENLYIHNASVSISNGATQIQLVEKCDINADELFESNKEIFAESAGTPVAVIEAFYYSLSDAQQDSLILSYYPDIPQSCKYLVPSGTTFIGEEGKTYNLDIVTQDNKVLSSSTTIPLGFYIDSLSYEYNEEYPGYAKVLVNLTFPPNQNLGKYVKFGSKKQGEDYFFGGIGGSVYSDAAFAGSTNLSLPLLYNSNDDDDIPFGARGNFLKGDTASLIWMNIDRSTYDFLYSVENDGGASPFSSPTKPQSNIEGGLGLWGGYNISEYSVYIPL
ncbi:MAG: DUF4249 family protein [Chitinophagales bacterium]